MELKIKMDHKNNNVHDHKEVLKTNVESKHPLSNKHSNEKGLLSIEKRKSIEIKAYYNWVNRGRPMWDQLSDWLIAEKQS